MEMGGFYGVGWMCGIGRWGGFYGDGWDVRDGWILGRWVVFTELDGFYGDWWIVWRSVNFMEMVNFVEMGGTVRWLA